MKADVTQLQNNTISVEEKSYIFNELNATKKDYIYSNSLSYTFEKTVEKNPDKVALIFKDEQMTYKELNQKANQYANYFRELGIDVEVPVGIYMDRSLEMMFAIYGVIKAGGAYVPLDPEYPEERLCFIADDLALSVIIKDNNSIGERLKASRIIVDTEEIKEKISHYGTENIKVSASLDNMAYIIYTSGSTGKPKGAIITHNSVLNRMYWMQDYFELEIEERVLHKTPISFDVSVWELFWPLLFGGTLVLAQKGGHKDTDYLIETIIKEKITTLHFVPSMLQIFLDNKNANMCKSLRRVICSGEALEKHHVTRFYEKLDSGLFNLYGPTEATVDVSFYECKKDEQSNSIPIGKPIYNCELYILNEKLELVPFGEQGELYIGGVCLARGYYNRPELTKERFIENPFSNEKGSRLYKTGDLVKYREDGEILYLGRTDFQVKLRGLRIELGEIESCIREADKVKDVVVTVYSDNKINDKRLVAYIIPNKEETLINKDEELERVAQWKTIFDETYAGNKAEAKETIETDFSGWVSSYTDKNIPEEDMTEWVNTTVNRIKALQDKKILEIGCGTGLLMYQLALDTEKYVGIDLSDVAVRNLQEDIVRKGERWSHVKILQGSAEDLSCIGNEKFDCIVINSVIQLFPSISYLFEVIKTATKALADGGKLFIGDIRDYKFLQSFHTSVQYYKANNQLEVEILKERIKKAVYQDKELLISQEFFESIGGLLPEISAIEFMSKGFNAINELSKFRYDVVLYKNINQSIIKQEQEIVFDYEKKNFKFDEVEEYIAENDTKIIKLINVPNTILKEEHRINNFLEGAAKGDKLQDSKQHITDKEQLQELCPAKFYKLGDKYQRKCLVRMLNLEKLEVVYCVDKHSIYSNFIMNNSIEQNDILKYANTPVKTSSEESLIVEIRERIKSKLPEYMLPSSFMILNEFTYLPNGKLDRKALPIPIGIKPKISTEYAEPISKLEKELVDIWETLLKVQMIGIYDLFFELGGHSLLALKLLSTISKDYTIEITLSEFLKEPTVSGIAKLLSHKNYQTKNSTIYQKVIPDTLNQYKVFPLSDMQQAYFIGKSSDISLGNVSTHVYTEFEFKNLDKQKFENALNALIKRHGMLRCIVYDDGTQIILEEVPQYTIEVFDKQDFSKKEQERFIEDLRDEMFYKEIEFSQYPLFQVKMTELGDNKIRVHVCYENIVLDGASQGIMIEDMLHLYKNEVNALRPLTFSFRDYILAENEFRKEEAYKSAMDYWKERCKTLPESPKLPIIVNPDELKQKRVKRKESIINKTIWSELQKTAIAKKLTPNTLLLSVFSEVIGLWSGENNFTINIPSFHRFPFNDEVEDMIGEFGSILLLEVRKDKKLSFVENCIALQEQFWNDLDNNIVSGIDVLRELANYRENTLMPIVFTSLLTHDKKRSFLHENISTVYWRSQSSQVWLDAVVSELDGDLHIDWDYIDGIFDNTMLDDMFDCFIKLLNDLVYKEDLWSTKTSELLPDRQKKKYENYNDTYEKFQDKYIHQVFYESVLKYKDYPACITNEKVLTYNELYKYSIDISNQLIDLGVKPNQLVAIIMPKGWKQVVAAMAILFSGAAYLPLDIQWPKERLKDLLVDGEVDIVITQEDLEATIKELNVNNYIVVKEKLVEVIEPKEFRAIQGLEDLAYVIYTSGSTGKPKGVAISHKAVMNTILDINKRFNVTNIDRTYCISELHFDLSVYDIFGILAVGGAVVIPTENEKQNLACWGEILEKYKVTIWNSVPALMDMFENDCRNKEEAFKSMRLALLSGDWIPVSLPDRLKNINNNIEVISLGGATEASIWSIFYPIKAMSSNWRSVPYGRPLSNQRFYVLNANMELCPELVVGELYIGGIGLAKCYWKDEEKTNSKFITHPRTKERLYATGDLGRYLQNGNIEFIGRKDFQVKVNGYRIELGEIESILNSYKEIKNSVVVFNEINKGQKYVIAYYIADNELNKNDIVSYLDKRLPYYMIPTFFIRISEIPITSNGKVNRKALPIPKLEVENTNDHTEPKTKVEEFVLDACRELLNQQSLTLADDFFIFGGNSIIAIRFIAKVREQYNIDIKMKDLFLDFKISKWAKLIENKIYQIDKNIVHKQSLNYLNAEELINIKYDKTKQLLLEIGSENNIPLSYAQEAVWLQELMHQTDGHILNGIVKINGKLSIVNLKKAITHIVKQHSIFTMKIEEVNYGDFIQTQRENEEIKLEVVTISENNEEEIIEEYKMQKAKKKFNMVIEPFYDFLLLCCKENSYTLIITLHHIISDEETFTVFYKEMIKAYHSICNNEEITIKNALQYSDYSCWQRYVYEKQYKEKNLAYWKDKLKDLNYLSLFNNKSYEGEVSGEGKYKKIDISNNAINEFLNVCVAQNASLYMGFISLYSILLSKISGENVVFIGTPLSNRNALAGEELCGLFTNMTVMPIHISTEDTFKSFVEKVCTDTLEMMEHGMVPFNAILHELNIDRRYLKLPYHININYLGARRDKYSCDEVTFNSIEFIKNDVAHNLGLLVEKVNEIYTCSFSYRTGFISDFQTSELEKYFCLLLKEVIEAPDDKIETYLNNIKCEVSQDIEALDFNW